MLLEIRGRVDGRGGRLDAEDVYVPLSFRVSDAGLSSPYVWLAQTSSKVLEVKIDRESKAVGAVILVLADQKRCGQIPPAYREAEVVAGLPTVATVEFARDRPDSSHHPFHIHLCDFDVLVSGHDVFVILDRAASPSRCYRQDRLGLFEAQGNIVGIGFFELTDAELRNVDRLIGG